MRVRLGRAPMGRPARMADAAPSRRAHRFHRRAQFGHPARPADDLHRPVMLHRDARGVVSAVFQPAQARQQHVARLARARIPDYAAHRIAFRSSFAIVKDGQMCGDNVSRERTRTKRGRGQKDWRTEIAGI